mmetsp:Transcript_956/g.1844  ORF Transcript_956/g.1844 Transcript_956/m.1844 type:complete len:222 (-) Transcript_956:663-1328(-)
MRVDESVSEVVAVFEDAVGLVHRGGPALPQLALLARSHRRGFRCLLLVRRDHRRALHRVLLARAHGLHVLALVLANVLEDVEEAVARRTTRPRCAHLEIVEEVEVRRGVVVDCDRRRRQRLEPRAVHSDEGAVCVHGVRLEQLHELVGDARRAEVDRQEAPVVHDGGVVREEAVGPGEVAAERLEDEQVVQLVPLLRVVHLAKLGRAPPAEALIQVEHRRV